MHSFTSDTKIYKINHVFKLCYYRLLQEDDEVMLDIKNGFISDEAPEISSDNKLT